MKRPKSLLTPSTLLIPLTFEAFAFAEVPTTATAPTSAPADKWQNTLFNPTPIYQLRGMDTDRPNVTNTPHTIDSGHLQIEAGVIDYSYFRDHSSGNDVRENDFDFGRFNFRLGVLNNLEINAAVDAYDLAQVHDDATNVSSSDGGFGDTTFGAKLNLWGNEGGDDVWKTSLAIQPQLKFPTARSDVGAGRFEFAVNMPFLMNLPAGFHLGLQSGVSYERNTGNTGYVAGFPTSASVDRVVIGSLDVYLEYACDPTTEKHVKDPQTIDIGGSYPLTDNIVIDAGVNFGLNKVANNIEVLAGISIRF